MDRNKVNIEIFGSKTIALVDTGAAISCISEDLYHKMKSNSPKMDQIGSMNIYGVGGEQHRVIGKVILPLKLKGLVINYGFYIIGDLQYPLILGDDFLRDNKCNIHYPSRTLYMHENALKVALITTKGGKAKAAKRYVIPAKSIADVPVFLPKTFMNNTLLLEPVPNLFNYQVMGASCLVKTKNARTKLQIINPNDEDIVIQKYSALANIVNIEVNSVQSMSDCQNNNKHAKTVGNINIKNKKKSNQTEFDLTNSDMTNDQKERLKKFMDNNGDIFSNDLSELGVTNCGYHEIETEDSMPIRLPPYRAAPAIKTEIEKQVDNMKEHNIIQPSTSPWTSPVVLVKKKDGSYRFAVDYRRLNSITKPMSYPLPNLDDVFDAIGEAKATVYSSLDLSNSFWQVPLHVNSKEKAAFITHSGVYEWTRMPFGLRNSSITFSRVIGQVLQGLNWKNVLAYVDDILIFSKNFDDHLKHLNQVFDRLRKANFTLKPSKCHFGVKQVKYLGHVLTKEGVKVDPAKIEVVKNHPRPKNQHEVRQFLGLANYYRRYVKDYAKIAVPLNSLLQKDNDFKWTSDCDKSFESLRTSLTTAPILAFPDMSKPFHLTTDASGHAIGYILGQLDSDKKERVISYGGRALRAGERKWTVSEKECLAVLEGIKHNNVYLSHRKFTVYTDHKALVWLHKVRDTNAKLGRWALQLQNYTFDIIYREGKKNQNADAVSRIPYPPSQENEIEEPLSGKVPVINCMDSASEDETQTGMITEIRFEYEPEPQYVSVIDGKSVHFDDISEVAKLQRQCDELSDLVSFLESGRLPEDDKKARLINFDKDMYRLGTSGELIHQHWPRTKGVPRAEVMIEQLVLPKVLREDALLAYHDCKAGGGHTGTKRTYAALQLKYYWKGMYQEVYNYVISCDACQRAKRPTNKRPAPLMPLPIAETFDRWHMDILTCLPKTKDGYQHILLVVDSFSRWSEAFPLRTQEAKEIAHVLYNQIFTRFGCPKCLVSDRGANFLSKLIQALCELFQITRHHTSSYHPQSNTTCERMNSTIAQTLRTYCDKDQMNWADLLPSVMMALRMSPNTESTGFSPYHMVFGKEMNIPFDIAVKPKDNLGKPAKEHIDELIEHLTIVQKIAKRNVSKVQEKTKETYDKKAKQPDFKVGDRVLLQCMKIPKGFSPKLHAKWEGPFYINHANQNTYKLRRIRDHKLVKSCIHANRLKRYEDPRDVRGPIVQMNRNDNGDNRDNDDDNVGNNDNINNRQDDNDTQDLQSQSQTMTDDNAQIDENVFEAEKLVARRRRNGENFYRVKWLGYKKTTWVPEKDIGEGLLVDFYTKHTQSGKSRKKKLTSCFKRK